MESRIFMCYVAGSGRTGRTHSTQDEADKEAKRLSGLPHNLGKKVYALAAIVEHITEKEGNNAKQPD